MNLSMRQLKAFIAVARVHSFTRAAQQIHMTQAGLSLMLRDMEEQVGFRLFHRTTRAVWLSTEGEHFLPHAERAIFELEAATAAIALSAETASRKLVVAATPLIAASVMPSVCRDFQTSEPTVQVVLLDVERSLLLHMVDAGKVDVGFGVLVKATPGIQRQALFKVPLVCVSPSAVGQPLPAGTLRWSALKKMDLIALPPENAMQQFIDNKLKLIGRANESSATFSNLFTLIGMVEAGFGSAILPSFVRDACSRYRVQVRSLPTTDESLSFYAVTKSGLTPAAVLHAFLATFVRHMASQVPGH